ncbi:hypothetical protein F4802DRAFT_232170 [Xylaria palmicola]|nr:hypothetical protein F4802DRAFT_232170 [Xylaria palmicola]
MPNENNTSKTIKFLEGFADHALGDPAALKKYIKKNYHLHDAKTLVQLVMIRSYGATDPSSAEMQEFKEQYLRDNGRDLDRMALGSVEEMIQGYYRRLDRLFFFGLLRRRARLGGRRLVRLQVSTERDGNLLGAFVMPDPRIEMSLYADGNPTRLPFESIMLTLVHEMCHAYLWIFADNDHAGFREEVEASEGHGSMFWMLLRFVTNHIFTLTKSNRLWGELLVSENEHRDAILEATAADKGRRRGISGQDPQPQPALPRPSSNAQGCGCGSSQPRSQPSASQGCGCGCGSSQPRSQPSASQGCGCQNSRPHQQPSRPQQSVAHHYHNHGCASSPS